MEKSIYIVLMDLKNELQGEKIEKICSISKEKVDFLKELLKQNEKLEKNAKKLREKTEQIKRQSRKFLNRVIMSHGISYSKATQAVGISKEDDIIYIGDRKRVIENPENPPLPGDKIVGKLTKYERRKYNELLEQYNYLANKIDEHNNHVHQNEKQLIEFEKSVLKNKIYNKDNQYLVVSTINGNVYLVDKVSK